MTRFLVLQIAILASQFGPAQTHTHTYTCTFNDIQKGRRVEAGVGLVSEPGNQAIQLRDKQDGLVVAVVTAMDGNEDINTRTSTLAHTDLVCLCVFSVRCRQGVLSYLPLSRDWVIHLSIVGEPFPCETIGVYEWHKTFQIDSFSAFGNWRRNSSFTPKT